MVKKTEFYRLLKPSEVLKIESEIKNSDLRMSFKTAVNTGMRYKELQLFAEHPEWFNYNRKIIIIPRHYTKTKDERKVNLTPSIFRAALLFSSRWPQAEVFGVPILERQSSKMGCPCRY